VTPPVPRLETLRALVKAGHATHIQVFVHALSTEAQTLVLQSGADVIAHQFRAAHSAQLALAELSGFVPRIALLDIGLPDMTGYELARLMRAAAGDSLRLIAVSGYGQPEDRLRSQSAGFNAHLVKPVRIEDLRSILASENVAR
jgi:CheY-like chemotaxis protein